MIYHSKERQNLFQLNMNSSIDALDLCSHKSLPVAILEEKQNHKEESMNPSLVKVLLFYLVFSTHIEN